MSLFDETDDNNTVEIEFLEEEFGADFEARLREAIAEAENSDSEESRLNRTLSTFLGLKNARPHIVPRIWFDAETDAVSICFFDGAEIYHSAKSMSFYALNNGLVSRIDDEHIADYSETVFYKATEFALRCDVDTSECFLVKKSLEELAVEHSDKRRLQNFFSVAGWQLDNETALYCVAHLNHALCVYKKRDAI